MRYSQAFIIFVALFVVFFTPVIFRGEVIYPHNNDIEVGAPFAPDPAHISNGKFFDESSSFIPEITFHLRSRHRAWLATWNPDSELGRPAQQMGGLSKAYLPSNILSFFTDDPFIFYAINILLTVFLSGLFMFLLMKSLDLSPPACLIAAVGVSFGVFYIYWLTFNTFISPYCWALGLMWLSRRFIQRASLPLALGLVFASYSLFMTAYPQSIVLQAYIIVGFVLVLLWKSDGGAKKKALVAAMLGGSALFGLLMTAPVYMDLLETASRSARLNAGSDFFLRNLPKISSPGEFFVFLNSIVDAFIFGNPIKEKYIFGFGGFSLSPLYTALFLLTFIKGLWRRVWPWQVFIFLCFIGTVWPAAHMFAVRHMGFNMSATTFIGGAVIPVFILVGYAVDNILYADEGRAPLRNAVVFFSLIPLALLFIIYGVKLTAIIDMRYLILNIVIIIILYALCILRSKSLKTYGLLALTLVTVFVYGRSLMLIRPEANIHTTSKLVKFIKAQTAGGSRLAFVGYKNIIPPNQESLLGLKSIHTYDSLSSKEYQGLVKKLSTKGTYTYGRHFDYITDGSRLGQPEFSYTGIGLYISSMELQNPGLVRLGQWRKYRFYKPMTPPFLEAQVIDYEQKGEGAVLSGRLNGHEMLPARRLDAISDYKTYSLTPATGPTLLFISQQYHPRWRARSKDGPLRTVMVNDFYEGVIIPPGTVEAMLEFRPFVLWMWVPQVIFILLGAGVALQYVLISRKRKGEARVA